MRALLNKVSKVVVDAKFTFRPDQLRSRQLYRVECVYIIIVCVVRVGPYECATFLVCKNSTFQDCGKNL